MEDAERVADPGQPWNASGPRDPSLGPLGGTSGATSDSVGVGRYRLAASGGDNVAEDDDVGRLLQELDGAVTEEGVAAAGVRREGLLVGTRLVRGPEGGVARLGVGRLGVHRSPLIIDD